jgi:hypothetical protein
VQLGLPPFFFAGSGAGAADLGRDRWTDSSKGLARVLLRPVGLVRYCGWAVMVTQPLQFSAGTGSQQPRGEMAALASWNAGEQQLKPEDGADR